MNGPDYKHQWQVFKFEASFLHYKRVVVLNEDKVFLIEFHCHQAVVFVFVFVCVSERERERGMRNNNIISSSVKCFQIGSKTWSSTFIAFVVMLLVSFFLFSVGLAPFSSSFSSFGVFGGGGGREEHDLGNSGGGEEKVNVSSFRDGDALSFALPPSFPPSPLPEPGNTSVKGSGSKEVNSVTQRARRTDVKLERLELGLARARDSIREVLSNQSQKFDLVDSDYMPQGPVYKNAHAFYKSYLEMEKLFKVHVYEEGEPPLFHDGPCRSIYSTEGRFINNMEMENRFRTRDPDLAHVHFLPFSVVKMVKFIHRSRPFDISALKRTIVDYIHTISNKYPYWNRSLGADHFMLSCHDWGPDSSHAISNLYSNSIRVLCNANTSEGFHPSKDVSLPEINLITGLNKGIIGGPSPSRRPTLAFFAGGLHGPIRGILLQHWKNKDESMQIHEYLPKGVTYYEEMRRSKFCICPSGYEVASPRIVESIYLECVPVIICDHYVSPFSDVLNWKSFSVSVAVEDIPKLKDILMSVSPRQYLKMQRRVKIVQRHFVMNTPPKRFDVYHMILHSIWLRRLNIKIQPQD